MYVHSTRSPNKLKIQLHKDSTTKKKKLTPKTQTRNIGIHNATDISHKRFGENCTYIITISKGHTQTHRVHG